MQTIQSNSVKKDAQKRYLYSFFIGFGFCLASFFVLYFGSAPSIIQLKEGDIFSRTIYAPYEFSYPTGIDTEKTEETRKTAEDKVPLIYDIDGSLQSEAFTKLDRFFDTVQEIENRTPPEGQEDAQALKFAELKQADRMRKISKDTLENVFLVGIVPEEEKTKLIKEKVEDILIRNQEFKIERNVNPKDLIDVKEANKIVNDTLLRMIPKDKQARRFVYELIEGDIKTNLKFDNVETQKRREDARNEVLSIYRKNMVKKDELIIEKGKKLTKEDIAKLTQITRVQAVGNRSSYLLGLFIILLGLTLITISYLSLFNKKLMKLPKNTLLIAINAFLAI
ncbi:MAG: hypothetical protein ABIB11_02905, partial [Candidatus Omnitrophota bacterium]